MQEENGNRAVEVDRARLQLELDHLKAENRQLKIALQERKQQRIGALENRTHADHQRSDDGRVYTLREHRQEEANDLGVEGIDWIAGTPQIKHELSRKRCRYILVS